MVNFNDIKLLLLVFGVIQFVKCQKTVVELNLFLEGETPEIYDEKSEKELFMGKHKPADVDQVLVVSFSADFKKTLVNPTSEDKARLRLTEFQRSVKELEEASGGKLKVRTIVLTKLEGNPKLISKKLGKIIDTLWQKFIGENSSKSVYTMGLGKFNVPVLCERTKKYYFIYENPLWRYCIMNLSNEGIHLVPGMAKEYPVPLPDKIKDTIQKDFQVEDAEKLVNLQNGLGKSIKDKLSKYADKYKMDEIVERRIKMQKKIKDGELSSYISFFVYNCQSPDETGTEIKIYRHPDRPNEYIPDPKNSEYTYLDDASSTKLVLAIILDHGTSGSTSFKDDEWIYIYNFAKWLTEVSENLLVRLIVTKGLQQKNDGKGMVGDFLDAHGQRNNGILPVESTLTFGFNSGNKAHQNYLDQYYSIYENPYLRYIFTNMRTDNWLDPFRRMAEVYPVRSPAIIREDENGRLLQIKMQMDIEKVQNDVQIQLLEKLSQSTTNFNPKELNELKKKMSKDTKKGKLPAGVSEDQRSKIEAAKFEFIDVFGSGGSGGVGATSQASTRKRRNSQGDAASSNKTTRTT